MKSIELKKELWYFVFHKQAFLAAFPTRKRAVDWANGNIDDYGWEIITLWIGEKK